MSTDEKTSDNSISVLLVEDSRTTRTYIANVLAGCDDFEVLEPASDGLEAIEKAIELGPDVVLTDLHLPRLDGVEVIATIMAERPCPIVVLSGELSRRDNDFTFEALEAGAVKVIAKPRGMARDGDRDFAAQLAHTLRLMAEVQIVSGRHRPTGRLDDSFDRTETNAEVSDLEVDLVAIGASTGGPAILYDLLDELDAPYPLPIFVSQHIAGGFEHGLCRWLNSTGHDVQIPLPGTDIESGKVYLSPANASVAMGPNKIEIAPPVGDEMTPSIDRLFSSVARYCRSRCLAVLLTGMGRDGVEGLGDIRDAGGWTIAQDPDDAVVDSMPAAALEAGFARERLRPGAIAKRLQTLATLDHRTQP